MDVGYKGNRYQYNGSVHFYDIGEGLMFSMYRIHDPELGRWLQVDPKAELGYHMSKYNSMHYNHILYADLDGDWVVHARWNFT